MTRLTELESRKALLSAQADLARIQLSIAWSDLKNVVSPPVSPERSGGMRKTAAFLLAAMIPLFGRTRFGRFLRIASFGLGVVRAVSGWRSR